MVSAVSTLHMATDASQLVPAHVLEHIDAERAAAAAAAAAGGGNAPAAADPDPHAVAIALAKAAAAVAEVSQIPGADAFGIAVTEDRVITPYGAAGLSLLVLALGIRVSLTCVSSWVTAFGQGWFCSERRAARLVTLRPAADAPAPPDQCLPAEVFIRTTNFGNMWHSDTRCQWLATSTNILTRKACPRWARVGTEPIAGATAAAAGAPCRILTCTNMGSTSYGSWKSW
jgi:hypothetical protein